MQNIADKYAVKVQTPSGPVIIESLSQWDEYRKWAGFLERARRAKVGKTDIFGVSAFFTNSVTDLGRAIRGRA